MRKIIKNFDAFLCKIEGVFEFTADPNCLLRLQFSHAPHPLMLDDMTIDKGSPLLLIHLWNEHVPVIPNSGVDLAWARKTTTLFINSLHSLGLLISHDPQYESIVALGGATIMLTHYPRASGIKSLARLGFKSLPYQNRLGKFGEFWENFYSYAIAWTYNYPSIHDRQILRQSRTEIWISKAEFMRRYGTGVKQP